MWWLCYSCPFVGECGVTVSSVGGTGGRSSGTSICIVVAGDGGCGSGGKSKK